MNDPFATDPKWAEINRAYPAREKKRARIVWGIEGVGGVALVLFTLGMAAVGVVTTASYGIDKTLAYQHARNAQPPLPDDLWVSSGPTIGPGQSLNFTMLCDSTGLCQQYGDAYVDELPATPGCVEIAPGQYDCPDTCEQPFVPDA